MNGDLRFVARLYPYTVVPGPKSPTRPCSTKLTRLGVGGRQNRSARQRASSLVPVRGRSRRTSSSAAMRTQSRLRKRTMAPGLMSRPGIPPEGLRTSEAIHSG